MSFKKLIIKKGSNQNIFDEYKKQDFQLSYINSYNVNSLKAILKQRKIKNISGKELLYIIDGEMVNKRNEKYVTMFIEETIHNILVIGDDIEKVPKSIQKLIEDKDIEKAKKGGFYHNFLTFFNIKDRARAFEVSKEIGWLPILLKTINENFRDEEIIGKLIKANSMMFKVDEDFIKMWISYEVPPKKIFRIMFSKKQVSDNDGNIEKLSLELHKSKKEIKFIYDNYLRALEDSKKPKVKSLLGY